MGMSLGCSLYAWGCVRCNALIRVEASVAAPPWRCVTPVARLGMPLHARGRLFHACGCICGDALARVEDAFARADAFAGLPLHAWGRLVYARGFTCGCIGGDALARVDPRSWGCPTRETRPVSSTASCSLLAWRRPCTLALVTCIVRSWRAQVVQGALGPRRARGARCPLEGPRCSGRTGPMLSLGHTGRITSLLPLPTNAHFFSQGRLWFD